MHSSQRKQFVQWFCDRKKFSGKVWGTEGQPGSWSIFSKGASNRLHWEDRDWTKQGRARDHGEKFRFYFVCMRSHWKVLSRSSTWCNLCFKNLTSAQLLSISDFLYSPKNGVKKKTNKRKTPITVPFQEVVEESYIMFIIIHGSKESWINVELIWIVQ